MCHDIGDTDGWGCSVDKGRFLIETHLRTGRPLAELADAHGVHRSWLYKLLARYRAEGDAGLAPRSRRPHSSPTRIADRHEDAIVELRKELTDAGFDAGAATIHTHHRITDGLVSTMSRDISLRCLATSHWRPRQDSNLRRTV